MWLNHILLLCQYFGEDLLTPNKKGEWWEVSRAEGGVHQRDEDKGHLARRRLGKWLMKRRINIHPGHTVLQKWTQLEPSSVRVSVSSFGQEPARLTMRGNAENSTNKSGSGSVIFTAENLFLWEVHNSWGMSSLSRAYTFFLHSHTNKKTFHAWKIALDGMIWESCCSFQISSQDLNTGRHFSWQTRSITIIIMCLKIITQPCQTHDTKGIRKREVKVGTAWVVFCSS